MKTAETRPGRTSAPPPEQLAEFPRPRANSKIAEGHLNKLAIVYVRQSSPQQVLENREATARQYALADFAKTLGWSRERVLVIDEDQGQSGTRAEQRMGFQRLLAEVTMDHVGLVLGLEMSRLARSSKDWHHLLEVCAIFGTLLADQDGIYDPQDPNDRLLLGLKGTMSEVELHTMRNRLDRGRLNKAQRGELFHCLPLGYVKLPNGEIAFDPDQQARSVIQLAFDKFDDIGSIYGLLHYLVRHNIELPLRARSGPNKGNLEWRRANINTLAQLLHHPIFAGAYVYGRRPVDPKANYTRPTSRRQNGKPLEECKVFLKDRLPAYITWERYLKNQERLKQNRRGLTTPGTPGKGVALLGGVVVCGNCGRRMHVSYATKNGAFYSCQAHLLEVRERTCYGLCAARLDAVVAEQVLRALEPAAQALSLKAAEDVTQERARLDKNWQQQLQRARYDIDLAQRRYQAVDPANRLVAATLEKAWEEALLKERRLQEDYDRFLRESPPQLTASERAIIQALARDIPTLWHAPRTTNADRKQIVRFLIEHVEVQVRCDSEHVNAVIHWNGGYQSAHEFIRTVATYGQMRDFKQLIERVEQLRLDGRTTREIADALNAEGFRPPKRNGSFNVPIVRQLLIRRGLMGNERLHSELLDQHEWWLVDLARELRMSHLKLRDWITRGWLHARRTPIQGYWIAWADRDEVKRLKRLLAESRRGSNAYSSELTKPKTRPRRTKSR
jgi:DNA invertase Pin-like site-specific DNA recombinase